MTNEKLIQFAKDIVKSTVKDDRKYLAEKLGYIKNKKISEDYIRILESDLICDEKNNVETRTLDVLKNASYERYCICKDFLETLGEQDEITI